MAKITSKGIGGRHEEAVSGIAGILPGTQLKLNSSGEVILHTTAGGLLGDEILIAEEDALQGRGVTVAYTLGDIVSFLVLAKGDVVNMLIADEQNVAVGDRIISNGSGLMKKTTGSPAVNMGIALEDNDLTGSNTSNTLSFVRVT